MNSYEWWMLVVGFALLAFGLGRVVERVSSGRRVRREREERRIMPSWLRGRDTREGNSSELADDYVGIHRKGKALGTARQYSDWVFDTGELDLSRIQWSDDLKRESIDV